MMMLSKMLMRVMMMMMMMRVRVMIWTLTIMVIFQGYAKYELPPNIPIQVSIGVDITDIPKVTMIIIFVIPINISVKAPLLTFAIIIIFPFWQAFKKENHDHQSP